MRTHNHDLRSSSKNYYFLFFVLKETCCSCAFYPHPIFKKIKFFFKILNIIFLSHQNTKNSIVKFYSMLELQNPKISIAWSVEKKFDSFFCWICAQHINFSIFFSLVFLAKFFLLGRSFGEYPILYILNKTPFQFFF